jgi:hypothetical protein
MAAEKEKQTTLSDLNNEQPSLEISDKDEAKWLERARSLDFYNVDAALISQTGRTLLEEYSKIPAKKVDEHAQDLVQAAYFHVHIGLTSCRGRKLLQL